MTPVPHAIDIVVSDMAESLRFFCTLGLDAPDHSEGPEQTPGGTIIGLGVE